jgi:ATP-dependent DNA ligase
MRRRPIATDPKKQDSKQVTKRNCGADDFQLGCEGIVSKRIGSRYRTGRSPDWLKFKNPAAPAVRREAEEDWRRERGKK